MLNGYSTAVLYVELDTKRFLLGKDWVEMDRRREKVGWKDGRCGVWLGESGIEARDPRDDLVLDGPPRSCRSAGNSSFEALVTRETAGEACKNAEIVSRRLRTKQLGRS